MTPAAPAEAMTLSDALDAVTIALAKAMARADHERDNETRRPSSAKHSSHQRAGEK
jgi:hypothetical protein